MTDWLSCTVTAWVVPKVPPGRSPPAPPVPDQVMRQVTVAFSGNVPPAEERRYWMPQGGFWSTLRDTGSAVVVA